MPQERGNTTLQSEPAQPSKSQRKREAQAVKTLGERLVALPSDQLARVPLDVSIRACVQDARQLGRGGARKRQIQFLAKLLRSTDTDAIERALALIAGQSLESARRLHRLEAWREGLVNGDQGTTAEVYAHHPSLDRQQLNQLVRQAQKEREKGAGEVTQYRRLFRFLRDLDGGA